jgi:hypothetical protein
MFSILGILGSSLVIGCVPADDGDPDSAAGSEQAALAVRRSRFDITGIIGTGQSLSVGMDAPTPSASAMQPHFANLKLDLGGAQVPPFDPSAPSLSLVPLVEPIRPFATTFPSAYPANIYGETPHAAMAAQVTAMAQRAGERDYVQIHTVVGENGQGMSVIDKAATEVDVGATSTGRAYAATVFEASAIERLAAAAGKTYGIGAIVLTHGETDAGNTQYEAQMLQLWSDYNQDLSAITGQRTTFPLITSQQHGIPFAAGQQFGMPVSTTAEWQIGNDHPEAAVCSGPKYQYPYAADDLHLVMHGYELLGEKYGEVYFQRVVLGRPWQPLQPIAVHRLGRVVAVQFHVPDPPLAWDTTLPEPHQTALTQWAKGRGFELRQGATPIAISAVLIVGDAVLIVAAADVPAGATVGYAATSDGVALPGVSVRWGKLRDSDRTVGVFTGEAQPNYAVAFELPVP